MRPPLAPPLASVLDPASNNTPRIGAYRGPLPPVDFSPLGHTRLFHAVHEKRWVYIALAADPLAVGLAIVRLGYAANAFAFAHHRERGMLFDRTALAAPWRATVADRTDAPVVATFDGGGLRARVSSIPGGLLVDLHGDRLTLTAKLGPAPGPAISVVAPVAGGVVNATEKRALAPLEGSLELAGSRLSLDGGFGGVDYTHGLLARHTAWRWAFLQGRATSGEKVAVNLVQGFVGEPECAVWVDDELYPVGEGRFDFDAAAPSSPWRITTTDAAVDLAFSPAAIHAERKNLLVVRSRFVQPVGAFDGTLTLPGRSPLTLERALGVVEDQDVVW